MEALFFITHSLHTYAHKSQLDLHVRLHSMTNSTTWIPFLLFECCELPLDAYWTACWALKEDALQAGFQAAPGSLLVTQWQQRCSSLKINRTFEEVLTRCANSDTQHSQSFSHQMKEDLCDQSHLFVIFLFFSDDILLISHESFQQSELWFTCCCCGCDGKFLSEWQHFVPSWKDVPCVFFRVLPLICCMCLFLQFVFCPLPTSPASPYQPLWERKCVCLHQQEFVWDYCRWFAQDSGISWKLKWSIPSFPSFE